MVTVPHPTPHATRHLDRPSRFCRVPNSFIPDRQTDRQTTETSVAIGHIYMLRITMRPKNDAQYNIILYEFQKSIIPHNKQTQHSRFNHAELPLKALYRQHSPVCYLLLNRSRQVTAGSQASIIITASASYVLL